MADSRYFFKAKITYLSIAVELPVGKPIMGTCVTRTTSEWTVFFENLARETKDSSLKREYERCRVAIKWATACDGELDAVNNRYENGEVCIVFVFKFENFDDLAHFVYHFNSYVY